MKFNWKILVALVLIVGAVYWAGTSILPTSYSGTNLSFTVGGGSVKLTNSSSDSVPVQLVGSRTRSFSVYSTSDGISGSASREGTGADNVYLFDFDVPAGNSEFTITRGTNINFVSDTPTQLEATVNPMNTGSTRSTMLAAAVVIFVSLFYISNEMQHPWLALMGRQQPVTQETKPNSVVSAADNQGRNLRSYGDNRNE